MATNPNAPSEVCRACGGVRLRGVLAAHHGGKAYTVGRCRRCGALQTLERYADSSPEYRSLGAESIDAERLWCQGAHKAQAFSRFLSELRGLQRQRRDGLRLLDVGCGTGGFLDWAAGNGFETYGFDLSAAQAAHARARHGRVRQASDVSHYLRELGDDTLTFDVITLWDVVEHLSDPVAVITELGRHLSPSGLLFCATPNANVMYAKRGLLRLLRRSVADAWIPWEHLVYFSPAALRHMAIRAGLRCERLGSVVAYRRRLGMAEALRRTYFALSGSVPHLAPQICAWMSNGPASP